MSADEKPTTSSASSPPQRAATGSIPMAWAVPAEQSSDVIVNKGAATGSSGTASTSPALAVVVIGLLGAAGLVVAMQVGLLGGGSKSGSEQAPAGDPNPVDVTAPPVVGAAPGPASDPVTPPPPGPPVVDATAPIAAVTPPVDPAPAPPDRPAVLDAVPDPMAALPVPASLDTPPEDPAGSEIVFDELPVRRKVKALNANGEKLLRRGVYRRARSIFDKATTLDPTYPPAWRNLGTAWARSGNFSKARVAYETYLNLAPDAPDAPDVRRVLGQ